MVWLEVLGLRALWVERAGFRLQGVGFRDDMPMKRLGLGLGWGLGYRVGLRVYEVAAFPLGQSWIQGLGFRAGFAVEGLGFIGFRASGFANKHLLPAPTKQKHSTSLRSAKTLTAVNSP